jgi:hypothetical protein
MKIVLILWILNFLNVESVLGAGRVFTCEIGPYITTNYTIVYTGCTLKTTTREDVYPISFISIPAEGQTVAYKNTDVDWIALFGEITKTVTFPMEVFKEYPNLKTVVFKYVSMSKIKANTFKLATKLEELNLQLNLFTSLTANMFKWATKLKTLKLDYNQIKTIQAGTFAGLTSLETLELSKNFIVALPANAFSGLPNLKLLFLAYNSIATIDPKAFTGLGNLERLTMFTNQIKTLSGTTLAPLSKMYLLNVANNFLAALPSGLFQTNLALVSISFAYNNLTKIPNNLFDSLTQIHYLDLRGNICTGFHYDAGWAIPPANIRNNITGCI